MAGSSQKRTTMAKLNREAALRERRARKQAKKDARKRESEDSARPSSPEPGSDAHDESVSGEVDRDDELRDLFRREPAPIDPRAKEAALERLRDAPDEQLAVFEDKLRADAIRAGASEQEIREAQAGHPRR
jgi:hypothetical protein